MITYLLMGIIIILFLFAIDAITTLERWHRWNTYRKLERRAHLNLLKQAGR